MKDKQLIKNPAQYSLIYETRQQWQNFKADVLDKAKENIDFHHLSKAYHCIVDWFEKHGNDFKPEEKATEFSSYLTNQVKVIWYEPLEEPGLPAEATDQQAIALFTRLNIGRIPLTDAELVKALLLTTIRIKNPDRAQELAAQWDGIERDLQRPEVWAFISANDCDATNTAYPTRISLILDTLADQSSPPEKGKCYQTFETLRDRIEQNPKSFWDEVTALHAQIMGWMEDAVWHNKIGFLIVSKSKVFQNFVDDNARKKKKSEFDDWLTDEIRKAINLSLADIDDLSYENHKTALMKILLLFNVETLSRARQRFPFSEHTGKRWSLEHIHAQHSEGLSKEDQWKTWLEVHLKALQTLTNAEDDTEYRTLDSEITSAVAAMNQGEKLGGDAFIGLHTRIIKFFDSGEPDHSICNLALLSTHHNSQLNNAVFEAKRQIILDLDRQGGYIPICTRYVFLKYYAKIGNQQLHFWSDDDKKAYLDAITNKNVGIGRYLKEDKLNQDNL